MIRNYTTLFIDLDNTLFDFYKSEKRAIKETLKMNNLPHDDETAALYSKINLSYWEMYERGEIKKDEIFEGRFKTLLEKLCLKGDTKKISGDYFVNLSMGHDLMPGAEELLSYLKSKGYFLCAATNGVSLTQHRRLKESGIDKYFDVVCVSEDAGCQKPESKYFDFVIEKCPEKDKSKMLIIGDSQTSDVLGGINSGIDVCFFNPKHTPCKYNVVMEIEKLKDLHSIL